MVDNRTGYVLVALLTIASAAGLAYFAVLGLADPGQLVAGGDDSAARVFARYMAVRGLVLVAALAWLLATRAWRRLAFFLMFDAAVQLGDSVLGATRHQLAQTIGPAAFTVALAGGAIWLLTRASANPGHGSGVPAPVGLNGDEHKAGADRQLRDDRLDPLAGLRDGDERAGARR